MPLVKRTKAFDRTLEKALSKYERSRGSVEKALNDTNKVDGDAYPGFGENHIRKKRIALVEYGLRPPKGLRFVFLVTDDGECVPICVYKKGKPLQENEVKKLIKAALKEGIAELSENA